MRAILLVPLTLMAAPAIAQMGGIGSATSYGGTAQASGLSAPQADAPSARRHIVHADPARPRRVAATTLCETSGRLSAPVRRPAGYYC